VVDIIDSIRETEEKSREMDISQEELVKMIDHTELSPYATEGSIEELCKEAERLGFRSVCVNPYYTKFCSERLSGSGISIDTVVGFPSGQNTIEEKAFETEKAIQNGATEIDMVINVAAFRDEKYDLVKEEIETVVDVAGGRPVKVILETGYLELEEISKACKIVKGANADFVKNATGFGPYGANIPHIYRMRSAVGENFGVKAAGGIKSLRGATRMIAAGANRIGTSSGMEIINDCRKVNPKNWKIRDNLCFLCPASMVKVDEVTNSIYNYYKSKCKSCQNR